MVNITIDGKNVIAAVTDGATGNVTFYVNGVKQVIDLSDSRPHGKTSSRKETTPL